MIEKYSLHDEPGKTMVVFEKGGKIYGHILKDKTAKAPAKFIFETEKYETLEEFKANYPPAEE